MGEREAKRHSWLRALFTLVVFGVCAAAPPTKGMKPKLNVESKDLHSRLHNAHVSLTEMQHMLRSYYSVGSHTGKTILTDAFFMNSTNARYQDGIQRLADKLARAILWEDVFIVGAMGSSVTAGHDNCRLDSYESQLSRIFGPVLHSAGATLEVRNGGMTGTCADSHVNQHWCQGHIVGDDVDTVHYCWSYFETDRKTALVVRENWLRWALLSAGSAVPLFIEASCGPQYETPHTPENKFVELAERYTHLGANVLCMTRGISRAGYVSKGWHSIGDTLHNTTREGELVTDPERRDSLGVVWRNWHPGPLLFQTTADSLAHEYGEALAIALRDLKMEKDPHTRWPREKKLLSKKLMPAPMHCDPLYCDAEDPPACTDFEQPTFGKMGSTIMSPEDSMNPFGPLQQEHATKATWARTFDRNLPTFMMPRAERDLPGCAHVDGCAGWSVPLLNTALDEQWSQWLVLRLPRMTVGLIATCWVNLNGGAKKPSELVVEAGITVQLEGNTPRKFTAADFFKGSFERDTLSTAGAASGKGKCVTLQTSWDGAVTNNFGHLHMAIQMPPRRVKGGSAVVHDLALTHVITL